jgi:carotenoid cleavage dioxygenase-like enzyme
MVEPVRFPDIELYRGWGEPMRTECDIRGLELTQGALPEGFAGTLYRVGADRQFPSGRDDDIFIDGEGMIHMFRFGNNQVDYRSRWVQTERYKHQKAAQRGLFGRYRNRYTNDPSVAGVHMGAGNTTALFHAGRLYALKEDDLPYRMDPDTLDTLQRVDIDGAITATSFTAHPKVDPVTNELLAFSYQARGDATRDIAFYVFGPDRKLINEVWFEMPYAACVHDFAITDEWAVFPFFPLITDLDVVKAGGPYYQWHPDQQVHIALVPRYGTAEGIRWFKGPAASAGHMMNAFRDGSKVHLDVCLYEGNCFPFFPTPQGEVTAPVPPFLTRLTVDLQDPQAGIGKRRLFPIPCEMPRTDDRYQGHAYRNGFVISGRAPDGSSGITRIDVTTGVSDAWMPGPGDSVQEAQFVPRNLDSPEGDGWIVLLVCRASRMRSDLVVLDATQLAAGPVATFRIPVRVRATFHGMWVPQATLDSGLFEARRLDSLQRTGR